MKSLIHPLEPEFTFASFTFPKWVFTLPRGSLAKRIAYAKNPSCGGYYHAPKPLSGPNPGQGFYLDSDGAPCLRWEWCDQVTGTHIRHKGWYCDDYQDQTIRGIVLRLPHARGFLAGWSMGEGVASVLECYVYGTEQDAAHAADSMAESAAENEREYQAQENERIALEEAQAEETESQYWAQRDSATF